MNDRSLTNYSNYLTNPENVKKTFTHLNQVMAYSYLSLWSQLY